MKSGATSRKFPANTKAWEAVIAAAAGKDRPLTPKEEAALAKTVVVKKGGYPAVQAALAAKRVGASKGNAARSAAQPSKR